MPTLYIIAGPNGAGKTTASTFLLPDVFNTGIFINADVIAAQINLSNPEGERESVTKIYNLELWEKLKRV